MIFEVINDKGVRLENYEILKGKLISRIDIKEREEYDIIWKEKVEVIEKPDGFFRSFFRSKYATTETEYWQINNYKYHREMFLKKYAEPDETRTKEEIIDLKNPEEINEPRRKRRSHRS